MRNFRPTPLKFWLFVVGLAVSTTAAMAGECPVSGSGYAPPYTSPIGLPRCAGTIGRWTTCEICLISNGTYAEQDAYTLSYPTTGTGLQPRASFTQSTTLLPVDGFFDGLVNGHAIFRIRFTPTTNSGTWNFSTVSSDASRTAILVAFSTT